MCDDDCSFVRAPKNISLSELISGFRFHVDELMDEGDIDGALRDMLAAIDAKLGRIEHAIANFRIDFNHLAGADE